MAAEMALTTLADRLDRLSGLLAALRREAKRACPDDGHSVPSRLCDALPVVVGRLKQARAAVKHALRLAKAGGAGVRLPLAQAERRLQRVVIEFRRVGGLPRLADFADLRRRKSDWREWAVRVASAQRQAYREAVAAAKCITVCWRDMAEPATGAVTVNNFAVALAAPADPRAATKTPAARPRATSARTGGRDGAR